MNKKSFIIAFIITFICSISAKYLALMNPLNLIGALVLSLLLGMLMGFVPHLKEESTAGIGFISNKFLRTGIIFLGFKLNLSLLFESGIKIILLAIFIVLATIIVNYILCHRVFKEDEQLSLLTACGCGICGAAAVMGVGPQVKADKDNSIIAVAIVCILGTLFTLFEVFMQSTHLFNLSVHQYGIVAGSSLHEIAHAVAAGNAVAGAEEIAVISKLSRVLMLAPVAVLIGVFYKKTDGKTVGKIPVPYFMGGFLIASILGTVLPFPKALLANLVSLAYILLGMAMAALGMSVNFRVIKEKGTKTFIAAFIGSVIQLILCIIVAKLFF